MLSPNEGQLQKTATTATATGQQQGHCDLIPPETEVTLGTGGATLAKEPHPHATDETAASSARD